MPKVKLRGMLLMKIELNRIFQNKFSVKEYIENIKPSSLECMWSPKGTWLRAHGDNKSTTDGTFVTKTMGTSDNKYRVKVIHGKHDALGPVELPEPHPPSNEDVLNMLRSLVGL